MDSTAGPEGTTHAAEGEPPPAFGEIAARAGYLTTEQVEALVREEARATHRRERALLDQAVLKAALRNPEPMQSVLRAKVFTHIREEDLFLGRLAVRYGYAKEDQVQPVVEEQERVFREGRRLPLRLGEMLMNAKVLTAQELETLLAAQKHFRQGLAAENA